MTSLILRTLLSVALVLTLILISTKHRWTLGQYFSMPIGAGTVFGPGGDVVPERLNVIDLFID
jgi:hypothetical protein